MRYLTKVLALFAALIAAMMIMACTSERSAVDKTEELTLDKKLFEGEFFYRQTITDIPYTADFSFIGEASDGKIIKWKITKNWLIAYSIHDKLEVLNTEESPIINETPVLSYRILQHYDILPQENPTTGETLPVLTPNTDKPWNERRYFIIDNSQSGTTNFELKYLSLTEEWGAPYYRTGLTAVTDMEFYAHDGSFIKPKQYKETLEKATNQFDKEVELFTFYNQEYLSPLNDWGSIYNWEDIEEFIGTEPMKVTYRHIFTKVNRDVMGQRTYDPATMSWSFKKGAKENGFRPLEFSDELFRKFGFFTNSFRGYDPIVGYREKDVHKLANYFNISWAKDAGNATAKEWNFKCGSGEGTAATYNNCLANLSYQQKLVVTSSQETPLRMLPINCAMVKDYNYSMLAARFASMNPGSEVREFDKWYIENYKNDFFTNINGKQVRSEDWYMNLGKYPDWESKCFVSNKEARIQKWNGDFEKDNLINEIVVLVKNPVEAFIADRDGRHNSAIANYDGFDSENNENALRICVTQADYDTAAAASGKLNYYENCLTNAEDLTKRYVDDYGRSSWKGDGYDCKVLKSSESCPAGFVEAKAACIVTEERTCKITKDGTPLLRHRYMNGDMSVAMFNWVDAPTEYGILGVSQWNVNPETGMSLGGGSNIAGSVLQWVTNRSVELARMVIDQNDPASLDWEKLTHPDYAKRPSVVFDNNPKPRTAKIAAESTADLNNKGAADLKAKENMMKYYKKITENATNYNRFDFSTIKGSKWEKDMVPYSIRHAMFPWNDTTYSDDQRDMLSVFYSGPEAIEAELIKLNQGRSMDFFMDASFMDGAVVQFIKERSDALREKYPNWSTDQSQKSKYSAELLESIYDDLEKLMYKGVAQHEMGHTVGLRHNFIGSMDQPNYKDPYYASENYPAMVEGIKAEVEAKTAAGQPVATMGKDIYRYKKAFESKGNFYFYSSVMDYQREPYIHAVGLGKYDMAALKFVYGRSVEQYITDKNGFVLMDDTNTVRDPNYLFPRLQNTDYIDANTGAFKTIDKPKELVKYYSEIDQKDKMRLVIKVKRDSVGTPFFRDDEGNPAYDLSDNLLLHDGSMHHYMFFSDEKQQDEPADKIFDNGYSGADSIRMMTDQEDMFYYLRYFKRGNPKFREFRGRTHLKMIMDSMLEKYKFVHYLLDYNYNFFQRGWLINAPQGDACMALNYYDLNDQMITDDPIPNVNCEDFKRAVKGEEYWIRSDRSLGQLTPFSMGDYIIAGMEGVNYLLFDVIYRPETATYLKSDLGKSLFTDMDPNIASKIDQTAGQTGFWVKSNFVYDAESIIKEGAQSQLGWPVVIDSSIGRIHKDRYDIQDDPSIYYEEVVSKSYAEEKMVALYTLSNNGWLSGKYRRESMANSLGGYAAGFKNVIFNVLSDVANEDTMLTFSPYCVKKGTEENGIGNAEIVRLNLPVNTFMTWDADPPFYDGSGLTHKLPVNICAAKNWQDPSAVYEPIHAGWMYFDKMWVLFWGMANVMNVSADTTILLKFVTYKYPVDKNDMKPIDIDQVEALNSMGNFYYRATLPEADMLSNVVDANNPGHDGNKDAVDLRWWKDMKKAGKSDSEALCDKDYLAVPVKCLLNSSSEPIAKYASKEDFQSYLVGKYARLSPAFRLVQQLKNSPDHTSQKVGIMETTLDQLNSFARDQFEVATFYVSNY